MVWKGVEERITREKKEGVILIKRKSKRLNDVFSLVVEIIILRSNDMKKKKKLTNDLL